MVSIIAAIGRNRELGTENKLAWRLPDDLKRFRALTTSHAVIMGRKTFESIGKPLPQRTNIIVTRNKDYPAPGCLVVGSVEEAIKAAGSDLEIFIIGGGEIYKLGLPYADKMYLTFVDAAAEADTYFPEFNEKEWNVTAAERHEQDEKHAHPFVFKVYERKK